MLISFPILTHLNSKTVPSWPGCLELQLFFPHHPCNLPVGWHFSLSARMLILVALTPTTFLQDWSRSQNHHSSVKWGPRHLSDAPALLTQDKCLSPTLCTVCKVCCDPGLPVSRINTFKPDLGPEIRLNWKTPCLAGTKPCFWSPAPHKSDTVSCTYL